MPNSSSGEWETKAQMMKDQERRRLFFWTLTSLGKGTQRKPGEPKMRPQIWTRFVDEPSCLITSTTHYTKTSHQKTKMRRSTEKAKNNPAHTKKIQHCKNTTK